MWVYSHSIYIKIQGYIFLTTALPTPTLIYPFFYILYESYLIHCYWSSEAMLLKSNMCVRPSITNFPVWLWNRLMSILDWNRFLKILKNHVLYRIIEIFHEYWSNKKEIIAVLLTQTFGLRGSKQVLSNDLIIFILIIAESWIKWPDNFEDFKY